MKLNLILFFSIFTVFGQNIKGTVLEEGSQKPLENVNIYFKKEKTGVASDESGEFSLKTTSKINPLNIISFSYIGFESKNFTFLRLKKLNFVIHLSKKTENLDEVTVTSSQKSQISYKTLSRSKKGVYNFGSTLIDNNIFVIGGDLSITVDAKKRIFDEMSNNPEAGFEDFLKRIRSNFSWESYSDKLMAYNLKEDTWNTSKLKFRKRAYHKVVSFANKIYVLGGKTLSTNRKREYLDDKIEVLNLETEQIIVDNTNPHQAINFTAVAYNDNIIVMGGSIKQKSNGQKIYTDQSHIYNITSGYWYELTKMTKPKEINGIIIKNKVYLIGGFNKIELSEIESYDLITGKWKSEGNLFYGIENPALTHYDNIIYIFNDGKIMTFNTDTKILNEYRIDLSLKNAQIYCYENNLFVIGGSKEYNYKKSSSSRVYSIDLDEFSKTKTIKSNIN